MTSVPSNPFDEATANASSTNPFASNSATATDGAQSNPFNDATNESDETEEDDNDVAMELKAIAIVYKPLPEDTVNVAIQVDKQGVIAVSYIQLARAPSPPPPPKPLPVVQPINAAVRIIDHKLTETKGGLAHYAYLLEYSDNNNLPFVTSKRFNDFSEFHRLLSLKYVLLPPFPNSSFIRFTSDEANAAQRQESLTTYLTAIAHRHDISRQRDLQIFVGINVDPLEIQSLAADDQRKQLLNVSLTECTYDMTKVIGTGHIDVDVIKTNNDNNEQEMKTTPYINKVEKEKLMKLEEEKKKLILEKRLQIENIHKTALLPYETILQFGIKSHVYASHTTTMILNHPLDVLLVCMGDESTVSKIDTFFSSFFGSTAATKSASSQAGIHPLGALYAYVRPNELDTKSTLATWKPAVSMFFERELIHLAYGERHKYIFVSQDDGVVHILTPENTQWTSIKRLYTIQLHAKRITHLTYAPTLDAIFASSLNGVVSRFDVGSLTLHTSFSVTMGRVTSLSYDPNRDRLFVGTVDRSIAVYELSKLAARTSKLLFKLLVHEGGINAVTYYADVGILLSASADQTIAVWTIGDSESDCRIALRLTGFSGAVTSCCLSDDTMFVVGGDANGCISLWSRVRGICCMAWKAHESAVTSVSMVGTSVVSGSSDKTVKVWSVTS